MFKIFNGIHLVEAYHEWKKQKRDDKLTSRMIKLAIAIAVLIILWCLPSSVYGIDGLGVIQQRVIAIFGFAILMWVFEAIPAWTTSMAVVGLLLFATSDSSFWFFEKRLTPTGPASIVYSPISRVSSGTLNSLPLLRRTPRLMTWRADVVMLCPLSWSFATPLLYSPKTALSLRPSSAYES